MTTIEEDRDQKTMADSNLDPLLFQPRQNEGQPPDVSVTLPSRTVGEPDNGTDGEGDDGGEKRRKLNLWKCKQCREARKKVGG